MLPTFHSISILKSFHKLVQVITLTSFMAGFSIPGIWYNLLKFALGFLNELIFPPLEHRLASALHWFVVYTVEASQLVMISYLMTCV